MQAYRGDDKKNLGRGNGLTGCMVGCEMALGFVAGSDGLLAGLTGWLACEVHMIKLETQIIALATCNTESTLAQNNIDYCLLACKCSKALATQGVPPRLLQERNSIVAGGGGGEVEED